MFLEISHNSKENICTGVLQLYRRFATLLKKETLTQLFSCEFCITFKSTFFTEHLRAATSETQYNQPVATILEFLLDNVVRYHL